MNKTPRAITAKALITPDGVISHPLVLLKDGRIESISTQAAGEAPKDTLHLPETTLSAGFLDVHVHGAGGRDVMEGSAEAIDTVARTLASYGTTRFLATTVTATVDHILSALDTIATAIETGPSSPEAATPIGIHLEGPFLSHAKRGVHSPALLQAPSIELFDRFVEAARGHICLMTIAPELPDALDLIAHASGKGVRVSLGHSDAVAAVARAGIAAGAVSATHTFNAMRGLTQREPGMLGVVLDADELYAELICDGIHTTPEAVRLWLKMKGLDRALLVTDGMAATGMPDGEYLLGDMLAVVTNGVAMHDGALAGSVLTMDKAVANVQAFTGIDLPSAVYLASRNPAAMLGLPATSEWADFNLFDDTGQRTGTILRGRLLSV
ncbi:N-acetylglucosamine-6-phosphate deacetylase [Terriglobus roseus]|nr:N-acetylglucosamine-6-phosphate deacetylase [Terriglobus roseus]